MAPRGGAGRVGAARLSKGVVGLLGVLLALRGRVAWSRGVVAWREKNFLNYFCVRLYNDEKPYIIDSSAAMLIALRDCCHIGGADGQETTMQATYSLNELFAARGIITAAELRARQQEELELERRYQEALETARQIGNTVKIGNLELIADGWLA